MKRSLVSLLIFAACLIAPQLAAADTASSEARLSQTVIASGDPVLARANLHQRFSSVESVCFEFTFVNDLLDPGELLRITPLQLYPSLNGFGFEDVGPAPQSARTVCVTSFGYPDVTALFVDGRDKGLELGMETGSVEVASLIVTVTGTPRS